MPSGLNQILPRMRVSSDALRISALVAVGVTTGYFWRAAFEASPSSHPVSAPVNIVEPTPKPPVRSTVKPKPVVPTPHIAPRPAVHHFQPVRASHRPDAVAERSADSSGQADPAAARADLAAARSVASAGHADAARHDSDHAGSDDACLTCEGACCGRRRRRRSSRSRPPQPPPPTTGNDGDDHDNGHHGKGGNDGSDKPGWGHGDENHDHSGPKGHGG